VDDRRPAVSEVLQATALSAALAGYVFAVGGLVTWARLATARLPVGMALPVVGDGAIFVAGLRAVVVGAAVFAAMCAFAYLMHAGRWRRRAKVWSEIVATDRTAARARFLEARARRRERRARAKRGVPEAMYRRPAPRVRHPGTEATDPGGGYPGATRPAGIHPEATGPAAGRPEAAPPDMLVRLTAGFNVVALSVALGLVGGRFAKTGIDRWQPGHWWALLGPWAACSIVAALVLGAVNPLRGGRAVHGLLWLFTAAVAMACSAPVGLLVLTPAALAAFGRRYGGRPLPSSPLGFLRSPLPWVLLTVCAAVALAWAASPPVGFSGTALETTGGPRVGGWLGRTGSGVYLVSCTPLADGRSTAGRVEFVPAGSIESITAGDAQVAFDTGERQSLPTLLLHTLGVEARTPAWARPDLKARRAACAGGPPPGPGAVFQTPPRRPRGLLQDEWPFVRALPAG
jgi:hypothetical protein